jgi:formylglycine-generating enzyme required for sulfatase activity
MGLCVRLALLILLLAVRPSSLDSQGGSYTALVPIPAGAFTMGSASGPADERPEHRVELAAYSIERTPVTNRQFAEFLNAIGSLTVNRRRLYDPDDNDARIHRKGNVWVADPGAEQYPSVEPSWYGAQEYCRWAGRRLPTEAEWEKAARGADGRRYPWGNEAPNRMRAHFGGGWQEFVPAGSLPAGASPYGVLDMAGNGWEWVSSAYRPYPYSPTDGRENADADVERVTRGGGQDSSATQITTTYRGQGLSREPGGGHHNIGFRCAR